MIGLRIYKNMANDVRKILLKRSLINRDAKIKRENDFVIIPLIKKPEMALLREIRRNGAEIIETRFEIRKRGPRNLKDYLKGKIDLQKIDEIRGSFDVIGNIVILEIPDDLERYKYLIGKAALRFTKRKTIFRKKSEIKGVIRTRELEHLAGENTSETVYQEYGCRLMLDIRKVYFSPRLATERKRVADQVEDGELIVDMFAGVGPFSILIAKEHDVKIYAIDINPQAYKYIKKNAKLNRIPNKVIPLLGDAKEILSGRNIRADRIIMNLPGSAYEFLDSAINSIKKGGVIHYYEFASDFDSVIERLERAAHPRRVEILNKRRVRSKSPSTWHIGIDAKIF